MLLDNTAWVQSDQILSLSYLYPHPTFGYGYGSEYQQIWENNICVRQNWISNTDRILADQMRILIGYAKTNMVTDKLNGYTYITFYFIYNNIKCDTYYDIINQMIYKINTFHVVVAVGGSYYWEEKMPPHTERGGRQSCATAGQALRTPQLGHSPSSLLCFSLHSSLAFSFFLSFLSPPCCVSNRRSRSDRGQRRRTQPAGRADAPPPGREWRLRLFLFPSLSLLLLWLPVLDPHLNQTKPDLNPTHIT